MFRHLSIGHLLINERKSQSKNEKSRDDRIEGQQKELFFSRYNQGRTIHNKPSVN